jgi:phosphate transport system protein
MSLDAHRHFHDELSHVKVRLLTMSGEAEAALSLAVEALLERDVEKAQRVIKGDRVIDSMEVEIEEQCIHLLALQQPMARDLRMLTSALKIANDLERVGDHAVNIAQSAERLAQSRPIAPEPEIVEMARLARDMLSERSRRSSAATRPAGGTCASGTTRWISSTARCSGSCSPI